MSVQWESNQSPIDEQKEDPAPKFVAHQRLVMLGVHQIAVAKSRNYAERIARALNIYKPKENGR